MGKLKFNIGLSALLIAIAFVILCLHARYYLPFIADDALISLRYAKRLIEGGGLTWNTGERVEGYSNLLWVLSSAALGWLGMDLVQAVRALGFAGMGATLAAIVYAHPPSSVKTALPTLLALLFLALSGSYGAWTIGGMEQPMVAGLLAWAVVLTYPRLEQRAATTFGEMQLPGLLFALLCLTRLDGPLFTAAAACAILLVDGIRREAFIKAAGLAFLPVLFFLLQLGFRLWYYGEWIPNTALVKFVPSGQHTLDGWGYMRAGAYTILPLILAAAAAALVSWRQNFRRPRIILLLTLAAFWAAYVITIGGDIFPAWRHFVPLILLLVLLTALGGEWAGSCAPRRAYAASMLAGALLVCLFTFQQFRDEENYRAVTERWEWDGQVIGRLLQHAFGAQQPLMAVDPAGCLPYWSELPALDMLGLNDYYLPRHPPADLGAGAIGHELGDGKYVLDRQPDLVIFLLPTGAEHGYFLSGRQMQQDPRFFRDYTLVMFEGRVPYTVRSRVWVRRYSERIGIARHADQITVPGFLLNSNPATFAYLDEAGALVSPASQAQPARLEGLELPPGRWRIEVHASWPEVRLQVRRDTSPARNEQPGDRASAEQQAADRLILDAPAPAVLDLSGQANSLRMSMELTPVSYSMVEIRRVTLTRLPPSAAGVEGSEE